jgi:hypothetical protein
MTKGGIRTFRLKSPYCKPVTLKNIRQILVTNGNNKNQSKHPVAYLSGSNCKIQD